MLAAVPDMRLAARRRVPRFLFDYVDGGSYAEATLRANVDDLAAVSLRQIVLRDVSRIDTATTLFGQAMALPVMLGPIGLAGLLARRGEVQAAWAAKAAGVPVVLSNLSACAVDEVAAGAGAPPWLQLYMIRDRGFVADLVARARDAGCPALVFTVDLPTPGSRYRDYRSGLTGAPGRLGQLRLVGQALARPGWAWNVGLRGRPLSLGNLASVIGPRAPLGDFLGWIGRNFDPSVTWADIEWVRARWPGPLVVKGVLDPDDAREAVKAGADGIVVSNHGGRQLDGALSTVRALPRIADAVGGDLTVLVDGGVRSGLDVARMLALGAKGVLLGRAWAYALEAGGEAGVRRLLALIDAELRVAMALTGATRLDALDRSCLEMAVRPG